MDNETRARQIKAARYVAAFQRLGQVDPDQVATLPDEGWAAADELIRLTVAPRFRGQASPTTRAMVVDILRARQAASAAPAVDPFAGLPGYETDPPLTRQQRRDLTQDAREIRSLHS